MRIVKVHRDYTQRRGYRHSSGATFRGWRKKTYWRRRKP